ncbi:MAG: AI-2E family transporter [Crocinitomicaceae bacterium]|nr:AI-2E family transporter [Crocinitomicaceae bacterium]|tara:strand:+ start:2136 stop:3230 length:1095 start_codon:yes stop_codon:yes gene_type:complete
MNKQAKRILGFVLGILFLVLLWYIRSVVTYILIAIVFSLVARPLLKLLDKVKLKGRELPNALKAIVTLIALYSIIGGLVSVFVPVLASEIKIISNIDYQQVWESLKDPIHQMELTFAEYNIQTGDQTGEEYLKEKVLSVLDLSQVSGLFTNLISGLGNIFIALFSVTFITFFLLKDRWIVTNAMEAITPDKYMEQMHSASAKIKNTLTRYFLGLAGQITLITLLVTVSLSVIGIENALVIGFFAGLINVIPYLGPMIGAIFGMAITLTTSLDLDVSTEIVPLLLKVASVFAIVQLLDNFVFQPYIFSNSVSAHPLEIFLVIMIAGTLAGVTGMILAVPTYSFLRIIGKEFFSQYKVIQSITKNV